MDSSVIPSVIRAAILAVILGLSLENQVDIKNIDRSAEISERNNKRLLEIIAELKVMAANAIDEHRQERELIQAECGDETKPRHRK